MLSRQIITVFAEETQIGSSDTLYYRNPPTFWWEGYRDRSFNSKSSYKWQMSGFTSKCRTYNGGLDCAAPYAATRRARKKWMHLPCRRPPVDTQAIAHPYYRLRGWTACLSDTYQHTQRNAAAGLAPAFGGWWYFLHKAPGDYPQDNPKRQSAGRIPPQNSPVLAHHKTERIQRSVFI